MEAQCRPVTEQNPGGTAGATRHFEPWKVSAPLAARRALLFQCQFTCDGAIAQSGETVGYEAQSIPSLQVFRPAPWLVAIQMGAKVVVPRSLQGSLDFPSKFQRCVDIPLGGQARMQDSVAEFFIMMNQRAFPQPCQQLVPVFRIENGCEGLVVCFMFLITL